MQKEQEAKIVRNPLIFCRFFFSVGSVGECVCVWGVYTKRGRKQSGGKRPEVKRYIFRSNIQKGILKKTFFFLPEESRSKIMPG